MHCLSATAPTSIAPRHVPKVTHVQVLKCVCHNIISTDELNRQRLFPWPHSMIVYYSHWLRTKLRNYHPGNWECNRTPLFSTLRSLSHCDERFHLPFYAFQRLSPRLISMIPMKRHSMCAVTRTIATLCGFRKLPWPCAAHACSPCAPTRTIYPEGPSFPKLMLHKLCG